jgi:putative endonuclease
MLHSSPTIKRRACEHLGRIAEDDVAADWEQRGYTVLARRLRTSAGELDLVAASAEILVFIEVKARRSWAEAAYSVSPRQQARLLEAASLALACNPEWARENTRFDVALVCRGEIQTIEDALRHQ